MSIRRGLEHRLFRLSLAACAAAAIVAVTALVGWSADNSYLKGGGPGLVAMNPVTAVAFLLSALSLATMLVAPPRPVWQFMGRTAAVLAAIVGLLKTGDYLLLWNSQVDTWLFGNRLAGNCMAPNTAWCFALLGTALCLVRSDLKSEFNVGQILAFAVGSLSFLTLVGYSYDASELYRVSSFIPMALNTGALFLTLSVGLLCAQPRRGVVAVVVSPHAGGYLARRLLPAALIVPVALGWLHITSERLHLVEMGFGEALVVALSVLLMLVCIVRAAHMLNGLDVSRARARQELQAERDQLEARVAEQTQDIRRAHEETIYRLVSATHWRDEETGAHIRRTGLFSEILARAAGWSAEDAEQLRLAAPMHDIGKIGIPDAILRKPGTLTTEEYEVMKQHTLIGADMLAGSPLRILQLACHIARCHHERWDGRGYPRGLSGTAIPECARIVAIVDVYDALTHDRVYRAALPREEVLSIMLDGSGKHFDPRLLECFLDVLDEIEQCSEENPDERDTSLPEAEPFPTAALAVAGMLRTPEPSRREPRAASTKPSPRNPVPSPADTFSAYSGTDTIRR